MTEDEIVQWLQALQESQKTQNEAALNAYGELLGLIQQMAALLKEQGTRLEQLTKVTQDLALAKHESPTQH